MVRVSTKVAKWAPVVDGALDSLTADEGVKKSLLLPEMLVRSYR